MVASGRGRNSDAGRNRVELSTYGVEGQSEFNLDELALCP